MRRTCLYVVPFAVFTAAGLFLASQEPTPLPRSAVASVKPSTGPAGERAESAAGRYTATRTLKFFIADAFFFGQPLQVSRVIGGPAWIESALFQINTKANTGWQPSPDG